MITQPSVIDPQIEKLLKAKILPELNKGRKNFDRPHTESVVYWMKQLLLDFPKLDPQVMITAAYAHDWGYIGLFDGLDSSDIEVVHRMKPLHMERGAKLITQFLTEELSAYYTPAQIKNVAHLVNIHDLVEQVKTEAEVLLMETDTLGMLDISRTKPTFSKTDNDTFIEREIKNRRLRHFKHPKALTLAAKMAQERQHFYD